MAGVNGGADAFDVVNAPSPVRKAEAAPPTDDGGGAAAPGPRGSRGGGGRGGSSRVAGSGHPRGLYRRRLLRVLPRGAHVLPVPTALPTRDQEGISSSSSSSSSSSRREGGAGRQSGRRCISGLTAAVALGRGARRRRRHGPAEALAPCFAGRKREEGRDAVVVHGRRKGESCLVCGLRT